MYFKYEELLEVSWSTCNLETFIYYGELDDKGLPNGKGIAFNFSKIYEGFWEAGCRHGHGRLIVKHWLYIGDWVSNWRTGNGKLICSNRLTYKWGFLKNKYHGIGTFKSKKQHIEAEWEDGIPNGYGKLIEKDFEYKGKFANGRLNGNGYINFKNRGLEHWGNFKDGIIHGKGVTKEKETGWWHEGDFKDNKKDGFFILRHPIYGIKHVFYADKQMVGLYLYYDENVGFMDKGFWINGCLHRHMNIIVNNFIYLGDSVAANDKFWLNYVGVKAIVSVMHNESIEKLPGFDYFDINIKDCETENIIQYIPKVRRFIGGWISKGDKVLFHCKEGVSLSPAILIGWLMVVKKIEFNSAFEIVKTRRPCISLSDGFIKQLSEMSVNNPDKGN